MPAGYVDRVGRDSGVHRTEPLLPRLVGSSEKMRGLRALLGRIARTDAPVLVVGERGTGKELVVQELHDLSRADHTFYPLSCAAFSPQLVDAELFGHVRGAFTGALADRQGAFEAVGRGTLFLDELGRLSPDAQGKLLRVIETRRYRRIGETKERDFLGRVVTATNEPLEEMVREGSFREDLLDRVDVLRVEVPPLRDPLGDLRELVQALAARRSPPPEIELTAGAWAVLEGHDWPGNVRELGTVIERIAVLHLDGAVGADGLRELVGKGNRDGRGRSDVAGVARLLRGMSGVPAKNLSRVRREMVMQELAKCHRSERAVGRALGMDRDTVKRAREGGEE